VRLRVPGTRALAHGIDTWQAELREEGENTARLNKNELGGAISREKQSRVAAPRFREGE
jgi:hypothetical protein